MTETTHKSDNQTFRASDIPYYLFTTLLALSAVGFIFFIGLSLHYSVTHIDEQPVALAEGIQRMLHNFSHWFDVVFFQYNLILLSIAVAVPPMITTFYVMAMREEKKRRLLMEMPEDL